MSKPLIYSIKDFRRGISENIYNKDGVARIEHFDPINGQLRQFGAPALSTSVAYGSDIEDNKLESFAVSGTTIYALGWDSLTSDPAIFEWDANAQNWKGKVTFAAGSSANGLVLYTPAGGTVQYLYGLYSGTNIFRATVSGSSIVVNHAALTYTNYAKPFVHKKDNLVYFFTDNIVSSFNGTSVTTGLTLPANFRITSACEDGDYILIAGYDTDGNATGYLWDRDSSLATTTAKYDLGRVVPYVVAHLGGNSFFISKRSDSTNSAVTDLSVLEIRIRNGDRADPFAEYQMPTLGMAHNSIFATSHTVYFGAYAKLRNDASAKNVIFGIDHFGKLFIALNMGVNSATNNPPLMTGILREGDGWWIGGQSDGSWHITNTYTTTSTFETDVLRSDDLDADVVFNKALITCEKLPASASIAVYGKTDEDTAWTLLKSFSTTNGMKFSLNKSIATNALPGLSKAKQFQLQLVATGVSGASGAVTITGFMCIYDEQPHDANPT
jgi:hypothetical protein